MNLYPDRAVKYNRRCSADGQDMVSMAPHVQTNDFNRRHEKQIKKTVKHFVKLFRHLAEPEWPSGLQYRTCCGGTTVVGLSPKPPPMLVDTSVSMWIKKTQLSC